MEREIKFRFWDKNSKKWRYPSDHKFGILITDNGFEYSTGWDGLDNPRFGTEDEDGYQIITKEQYDEIQGSFISSQFTGLTDKNGKEIYEGDIYHQGDKNITYTVVWHDSGLIGKQNSSTSYAGIQHWQDRIEIIGNIYENPQLLKS